MYDTRAFDQVDREVQGENCHIVPGWNALFVKRLREAAIQRGHLVEILDPLLAT